MHHRPLSDYIELFDEYLAPFLGDATLIYMGGAIGIDSLALAWLADNHFESEVVVVVPHALRDQPADAQLAIQNARSKGLDVTIVELKYPRPSHPHREVFRKREMWMVERSDFVVAFPHGEDPLSGTRYTVSIADRLGKPFLMVPI